MSTPVICFDVDGTLVDADKKIHPRDRAILAAETDVLFIPATGRPLHALRRAFERNGLFVGRPLPLPLLLQNGAVLYRPQEQLLRAQPLAPAVRQQLIEIAGRFRKVATLLFSHNAVHCWHPDNFSRRLVDRFDLETHLFTAADARRAFTKFIFMSQAEAALAEIAQAVDELPVEWSHSLATVLEVNGHGVEKESGVRALLAAMKIEPGPVLAAGDGENDLPLLRYADRSFCPAQALPAVRDRCTYLVDVEKEGILGPMVERLREMEGR